MCARPALWEVVAQVDVNHTQVSGARRAWRNKPRRTRYIRVLSHEPDVAVVRVPPHIVVDAEGRLINVPVRGIGRRTRCGAGAGASGNDRGALTEVPVPVIACNRA